MHALPADPGRYEIIGAVSVNDEASPRNIAIVALGAAYTWAVANITKTDVGLTTAKRFYALTGKAVRFVRTRKRRKWR